MSDIGGGDVLNFDVVVNAGELNELGPDANRAFDAIPKAAERATSTTSKVMQDFAAKAAKNLVSAGERGGKGFGSGLAAGVKAGSSEAVAAFEKTQQQLLKLAESGAARVKEFQRAGLDPHLLSALEGNLRQLTQITGEGEANRAKIVADSQVLRAYEEQGKNIRKSVATESQQLAAIQRGRDSEVRRIIAGDTSKVATQTSGQLAVNAAKVAGQQRIAITRGVVDTIGRIEKGLGRVVEGTARTAVGAVGRIWAGTVGTVRRSFTTRKDIIKGGLDNEVHLFSSQAAKVQAVQSRSNAGLLGGLTRSLAAFGGGFLAFQQLKSVFTIGSDFSTGLRVLQTQLGLTDKQMQSIRQTAIDLGNDISLPGISALDAAQGIQIMAKQFAALGAVAPVMAQKTARAAIQLGLAVKTGTEDAAGLIGASVNVFKVAADQAGTAGDILATAISKSAGVTATDFKDAFNQAAPAVATLLVPIEGATNALADYNAALAALATRGLTGESAGAGLKQFFIQGTKLTKDGAKQMHLLTARAGETGTAFFTAAGKARPLAQTVDILSRGVKGYTQAQRTATLASIFGSRSVNIANGLIDTGVGQYLKLQHAITDSTGASEKFAAAQKIGVARALDGISSSIDTAKIKLFELLTGGASGKGPLALLALRFADLFDKFLNDGGPAFTALRRGLLGVGSALAAIVAVKAGVEVISLLASTLPLLLTPTGLLFGALAGLASAFFIVGGKGKSFQQIVGDLQKTLGDLAGKGLKLAGSALAKAGDVIRGTIVPALLQLKGPALEGLSKLVEKAKEVGRNILTFLAPAGRVLQGFFKIAVSGFQNLRSGDFSTAGDIFKNLGSSILHSIGGAISAIDFGAVGKAVTSKLGLSIAGGVAAAGIGAALGGPLGAAIALGLAGAFALALPKLRSIISGINVADLFGKFLNGVRLVGKQIAEILFDKRTLLAAAGIAAAAAAIAAQFALGFAQGLLHSAPDIASAIKTVFEQAFKLPSIVKSILALIVVFRKTLLGGLPTLRTDAQKIGLEVGKAISNGTNEGVQQGAQQGKLAAALNAKFGALRPTLTKIGLGLGAAVTTGLSAALSGSALGTASSGLEKGLAGAGIAASAAQAFAAGTAISGGNAVVGAGAAAASVAVSGLTAVLGHNAAAHAEAAARAKDFAKAMGSETDIAGTLTDQLSGKAPVVTAELAQWNVHLADFQKALASGKGDQFIANLEKNLKLDPLIGDAIPGIKFLKDQVKAYKDGLVLAGDTAEVVGKKTTSGLLAAGSAALTLSGPLKAITDAFIAANAAAGSAAISAAVDADKAKVDAFGAAADTARAKLHDLLFPPSGADAANSAIAHIPDAISGIQAAVSSSLTGVLKNANIAEGVAQFKNNLATGLEGVLTDPKIQNKAKAASKFLSDAISGINATPGLSPEAKLRAIAAVNELVAASQAAAAKNPVTLAAQADKASAAAVVASFQAQIDSTGIKGVVIPAQPDVPSAQKTGAQMLAAVGQAAAAGVSFESTYDQGQARGTGVSMANQVAAGVAVASLRDEGLNVAQSFAEGVLSSNAPLRAGETIAAQIKNAVQGALIIGSPSKVFIKIGQDTMEGFAIGLKDGSTDVISTAQSIAQAVIDTSLTFGQRVAQSNVAARGSIFDAIFGGAGPAANKAFEEARGSITSNFATLRGQVQQNGIAILQAAQTKPAERTIAENAILALKANSLALTDQFGIANRSAISAAVNAVEDFGKALLAQGDNVADVVKQLAGYRDILIATATAAGLSKTGAAALIDSLGLSQAKLNQLVIAARQAGVEISAGSRTQPPPKPAPPAPLKPGPNPLPGFLIQEGAIQIMDASGSPEATALAVLNRIAQKVRF